MVSPEVPGGLWRVMRSGRAEGIPCGVHYIGKPIFLYDSLRGKQVYGTSHYPWSRQDPATAVRYEAGECPITERALNEMISTNPTPIATWRTSPRRRPRCWEPAHEPLLEVQEPPAGT